MLNTKNTKDKHIDSSLLKAEGSTKELEHINTRLSQSQLIANYASWEWDLISNKIYWSENVFNILEYDPDKVKPSLKALFKRIHPDDLKIVFATIQKRVGDDKPIEINFRIIMPDKSIRTIHSYSRLECNPSTKTQSFLTGTIQNITERKLVENNLINIQEKLQDRVNKRSTKLAITNQKLKKESQIRKETEIELKLYEQIVSSAREFLSIIDKSYTYLTVNQFYLDSFHLKKDEIVGHTIESLHGKERFENVMKKDMDKVLAGEYVNLKHWIELPSGKRYLDVLYSPLTGTGGEIIGVVISARDITDENTYLTALKYSDELKGTILKTALDGIITINEKGEVQEYNLSAEKIFGYSFDEALGKNIADLIIPPRLREQHRNGLENFLKTGKKQIIGKQVQITAIRANGDEFPIELALAEIKLSNDRLFTAFIRDISEREKVEQELIESEQRYRTIVEIAPDCVKTITDEGMLLQMNPAGLAIIEADSLEEVSGTCVYDLVVEEYRNEFIAMNKRVFNGETCDLQFQLDGLKGTRRWLETYAVPIYESDSDSEIIGHLAVTSDISKRIEYQNTLMESEERFRSSFEHGPLGMGLGDKEGNILQVNKALCEISGYSEEELLNKNFREFIHPEEIELSVKNLKRLFSGEIDHYRQIRRHLHKQGHYVWADVNVAVINDAEGTPKFLINHLQDITERKRLENIQKSRTQILEALANSESIYNILQLITESSTNIMSEALVSILLLDKNGKQLRHGAATGLPDFYCEAIDGLEIGLGIGSCGEAAFAGKPMIVSDINTHPNWAPYRELISETGLRACWSIPILSTQKTVLGTFAIYYKNVKEPAKTDIELIESQAKLAAIAIERKLGEQILLESEERFRSSFEHGPLGMGLGDKEGSILQVNKALCEFSGYSSEELLNKNFREFIHPDDIELSIKNLKRLFTGEVNNYRQTRRYLHKQGHHVWADINVSVINDAEGKPKYLINHLQDITERVQSEHLQEAQREILEQIATGVSQKKILDNLCLMFESLAPSDAKASILLFNPDDKKLYVGAAPSLSTVVVNAFEGFMAGECKASCGTTAHRGEKVIVEDVSVNPLWKDFKDFALENKILACWSTPFFSEQDEVLGTFAISLPRPTSPTKYDIERLETAGYLANIVIERTRSIDTLRISEQKFRTLFDENPCMFFTVDKSARVLSVNQFGATELGYTTAQIIGRSLFSFTDDDQKITVTRYLKQCFDNPDDVHRWEMQTLKNDGTKLWVRVLAKIVVDIDNNNTILIVCEDITEAHVLSDKLVHQATHDGLTGLINRHEFETRMHRALLSAQSHNAQHVLCYLDLDRFKIINDTCGHTAGDELLRQLSKMLQGHIRSRDSLARLGGDEFGLLIEQCSLNKAKQIVNTLKQIITEFDFHWDNTFFKIGVSIGIIEINSSSISISDILMSADNACYTAKDKGRNRIYIHQKGDAELANRRREMLWTTRIQKAFEEDRFCLAYQHIRQLGSNENKREHGEILVRMEDEQGNIILPDIFIPAAERYNLITRIDQHVINMAFSWLKGNPDFLERLDVCSINLSGSSMADESVLDFIIQKISEYNIPANKICFEITETATIENLNSANHFITVLKKQGCLFALDDFGSGLSSFAYLKSLPVDYIKIDGTFVRDIASEQCDLAIVKSIHEISRALNKKTIAEFVENDFILNILEEIGVDYVQGNGISCPIPLDELK